MTITVTLPDNTKKTFKKGSTPLDVAHSISEGLMRATVAAKVNGILLDATTPLEKDCKVQLITFKDTEGKDVFWHSASHLMTQAVLRVFKEQNIGLGVGFGVEDGFYQDYDMESISPEVLEKIEEEMKKIVNEKLEITHKQISKKEALQFYKKDPYKTELIHDVPGETVTMYCQGEFQNLCKGPHVPNTGMLKAFKLTKVAGAYWRGDAKNKQLQRIYGVAFPDKKELKEYLTQMEEALKRDHRTIGKQLDLFDISETVGPGLIFWLPKGNIIKEELEGWAKEIERKWGYQRVTSPIITKESLFYTSEHLPHYKESMYAPMKIDNENYYIKPMNCPFHHTLYAFRKRSYRELPLRLAEYGWCHRYEDSGALMGLMRVRGMMMNDAHIYCTKEQAVEEFLNVIKLHQYYYKILGITEYWMEFCLRNPDNKKYHGDEAMWQEAEALMRKAMDQSGVKYVVQHDGAAFYGPKIDFQIKSVTGRVFTASTNQIDLFMPKKFNLTYIGEDGREHVPVVIHRAPLGTHERFIGFLIEQYAGKFPLWLNPVQVKILPLADRFNQYAEKVCSQLREHMIRAEVDDRSESLNKKVREAQLAQINYILVVGEKEQKEHTVNIRTRDNVVHGEKKVDMFLNELLKEIRERKL